MLSVGLVSDFRMVVIICLARCLTPDVVLAAKSDPLALGIGNHFITEIPCQIGKRTRFSSVSFENRALSSRFVHDALKK